MIAIPTSIYSILPISSTITSTEVLDLLHSSIERLIVVVVIVAAILHVIIIYIIPISIPSYCINIIAILILLLLNLNIILNYHSFSAVFLFNRIISVLLFILHDGAARVGVGIIEIIAIHRIWKLSREITRSMASTKKLLLLLLLLLLL